MVIEPAIVTFYPKYLKKTDLNLGHNVKVCVMTWHLKKTIADNYLTHSLVCSLTIIVLSSHCSINLGHSILTWFKEILSLSWQREISCTWHLLVALHHSFHIVNRWKLDEEFRQLFGGSDYAENIVSFRNAYIPNEAKVSIQSKIDPFAMFACQTTDNYDNSYLQLFSSMSYFSLRYCVVILLVGQS